MNLPAVECLNDQTSSELHRFSWASSVNKCPATYTKFIQSMEYGRTLEDCNCSAKDIPDLVWNPKARYRDLESPTWYSALNQVSPIYNLVPCFPMAQLKSPKWGSDQNSVCMYHLFHVSYMFRTCPYPRLKHRNYIWFLDSFISLSTLFSATLNP
jgi:hypothetical protein